MNFDMLQAIVEKMNLYNETSAQVLEWLNARSEYGAAHEFVVQELVVED